MYSVLLNYNNNTNNSDVCKRESKILFNSVSLKPQIRKQEKSFDLLLCGTAWLVIGTELTPILLRTLGKS
jgi:hypothetical protein